ncbi:hypothetical protein DPMN_049739 [Dreissena polymorpha]|uniref:Uncharacterized protein n=1 Tax=Dreissena polymorpha TaxID=45954 RepID=A0A9D4HME4_DREPO|nr:hypothetical protein DPMN_049739 [Dreissena polymorpha]
MAAPRGHRTQDTGLCIQVSPKTAPHLLAGAQDQRVRPEHDSSTFWPTRTLNGTVKRQKIAWCGHVTRLDSLCLRVR